MTIIAGLRGTLAGTICIIVSLSGFIVGLRGSIARSDMYSGGLSITVDLCGIIVGVGVYYRSEGHNRSERYNGRSGGIWGGMIAGLSGVCIIVGLGL